MNSTIQTNTGTSIYKWGFLGLVGGTAAAATATVVGGAPITAWVCTKCLFTGITAGGATGALGFIKKGEEEYDKGKVAGRKITEKIAEKTAAWSSVCMWGGVSLLSASISAGIYHMIVKDCHISDQSYHCIPPHVAFYTASGVCTATLIATAWLGLQYLTL